MLVMNFFVEIFKIFLMSSILFAIESMYQTMKIFCLLSEGCLYLSVPA